MSISFGGVVYNCVNTMTIDGGTEESSIICSTSSGNAETHKLTGAASWTVNATVVTEDTAITLETAFALGTSGALIVHPVGAGVGNKQHAFTSASVSTNNMPMGVGDFGTLAVTLVCSGDITTSLEVA